MKVTIAKTFDFDAAHWLPEVPDGHKCKNMHGHTYRVELVCEGNPDKRGFVVDYAEIEEAWRPLHKMLDHTCLNDRIDNPTSEHLAAWILTALIGKLSHFKRVRVYESSSTWCDAETRDLM